MQHIAGKVQVTQCDSVEALCQAAAAAWVAAALAAVPGQERFSTALSGGRIAHPFLASIAGQLREKAPGRALERLHFFWADERCVPPEDPESNFRIAQELLFEPLGIPADQVHRIRGEAPPAQAAELACKDIAGCVPLNASGFPVLDLCILGMGEDGHVASLFPGEPSAVLSSPEIYRAVTGPKPPPNRVTLGYDTLVAARQAWVLVAGRPRNPRCGRPCGPTASRPWGGCCVNARRHGSSSTVSWGE